MIHFIGSDDHAYLAELREANIVSPEIFEPVARAFGSRESASLEDFLLAAADLIPERSYLAWLVKRYHCHRFGPVWLRPEVARATAREPADANLPYARGTDGALLIAVLRPDRLSATCARAGDRCFPAAATLTEMRELTRAWIDSIRQG